MKKSSLFFVTLGLFTLMLSYSCKKDVESIIDCLGESAFFNVTHTIDSQNSNLVSFTLSYTGDHTLDNSAKWDFGDGQTQTLNGTTVQHTYAAPGNYTVTVTPTIRKGKETCSPDLEETVTIN